jgi:serine/threonine protein kinase/tetratricopeptide (TPR) repeat protein
MRAAIVSQNGTLRSLQACWFPPVAVPVPSALVSHYRLLEPLGSGGMGVVYRAEDTALGRTVALKFLPPQIVHDPKQVQRFREEARTASALNHPNICTIYEVAEEQGEMFIAMEFVEGRPLSESIRDGRMSTSGVVRYARQIAGALEHAHARGVIHRDLKPLNIVITPEGDAKILDFGLAKRTDPNDVTRKSLQVATATTVGLAGTMPYLSPEQLEGGDASARSDIWALGIVMYEMASGVKPFIGDNLYRLCTGIINEPIPTLPETVPPGLTAVIRRCLEKEPSRRYQRASEVRAALEALEPSSAVGIVSTVSEKPKFRLVRWAAAAAVLALITTGALWLAKRSRNVTNRSNEVAGDVAGKVAAERVQLAVISPDTNSQPSEAAFDSGLVDTLTSGLTELSERHNLAVIPPSEMRAHHVQTLEAARQEFGVNYGLMLNIQRAGGQVRVNYSLVDARSHEQLRGGTITAGASDPFALQDQVSARVTELLKLELEPQEKKALSAHGTSEPAAYDFYLRGLGYLQNYDKVENVDNAISVFRHALEKDPGFAGAYAGLGQAYWQKFEHTHENHLVSDATKACQIALEKDPALTQGHTCLGHVYQGTGKYELAVAEYQRASKSEPTLDAVQTGLARAYESLNRLPEAEQSYKAVIALRPDFWAGYNRLGNFYLRHGRLEEAAQMYTQVTSLVPDSFVGFANLGSTRIQQGRYGEAIEPLEQSLKIRKTGDGMSNLATAYFQSRRYTDAARSLEEATTLDAKNYEIWGNLGDAYYWAPGMRERASAAYRKALDLGEEQRKVNPRDAHMLSYLAEYHAMLGEKQKARLLIGEAEKLAARDPEVLYYAAMVYVQAGDQNKSLDKLESAVAAGYPRAGVRDTPNFSVLQNDPRFRALISQEHRKGKST